MNWERLRKQAFEKTVRFCCVDGIHYEQWKKMKYEEFAISVPAERRFEMGYRSLHRLTLQF
jgi:hypothetical protein